MRRQPMRSAQQLSLEYLMAREFPGRRELCAVVRANRLRPWLTDREGWVLSAECLRRLDEERLRRLIARAVCERSIELATIEVAFENVDETDDLRLAA